MRVVRPARSIFLSAVSAQFSACREEVASDLRAVGFEVHVQDDFTQDATGTLLQKLERFIAGCDCVIALVGDAFGSEPPRDSAIPRRSYTQWEYFFGMGERLGGGSSRRKAVYKYLASTFYLASHAVWQDREQARLQAQFVQGLVQSGEDRARFDSVGQLRAAVLRDVHGQPGGRSTMLLAAWREEIRHSPEFATRDLHGRRVGEEGGVPYLPLRVGQGRRALQGGDTRAPMDREQGPHAPPIHEFHRRDDLRPGMELREAPVSALLAPGRRLILGGAGSGKSTLVRWLARRELEQTGRVALLVNVSSWAEARKPFLQYWAEWQFPAIRGRLATPADVKEVDQLIAAADDWLADGLAYIVLDGLDEVSERHLPSRTGPDLQEWKSWLDRPVPFAGVTIVLTARYGSWLTPALPGPDDEFELLPLRPTDTHAYLQQFFLGRRTPEAAAAIAASLEEALANDPVMSNLVGNPFFLELAAFVFEAEGLALPANLARVFDRAIEALLVRDPQRASVPSLSHCGLDEFQARCVLERVAWESFRSGNRRDLGRTELLRLLGDGLAAQGRSGDAGLVLSALVGRRLLTERGSGYQFLHLSVQEFLAACYLTDADCELDWLALVERNCWHRDWELLLRFVAGTLAPLGDGRPRRSPEDLERLVHGLLSGSDDFHARRAFLASACLAMAPRGGSWEQPWRSLVDRTDRAILERTRKTTHAFPDDHAYLALLLWRHGWLSDWLSHRHASVVGSRLGKALLEIARNGSWGSLDDIVYEIDNWSGWGDEDVRDHRLKRYLTATHGIWFLGRATAWLLTRAGAAQVQLVIEELKQDKDASQWLPKMLETMLANQARWREPRLAQEPRELDRSVPGPDEASLLRALHDRVEEDVEEDVEDVEEDVEEDKDYVDPLRGTRTHAARMLAARHRDSALPALVAILQDVREPDYFRRDVVEALAGANAPALLAALVGIIEEPGDIHSLREAAARALVMSGDEYGFRYLLDALDHGSWDIRQPAALAVAEAARPEAHAKLARLLGFDHQPMAFRSTHAQRVWSLGREYARTAPILIDRELTGFNARIVRSLAGTRDPAALGELLKVLRTGNGRLRVAAAEALAASCRRREIFERMLAGEFGEPPDLDDTVEALVVPLWPDFIIWPDGRTSSIDELVP